MMKINLSDKKYIFVDYFDTVVFRDIHSCQVLPQWAKAMRYRFRNAKDISADRWLRLRSNAENSFGGQLAVPYTKVVESIWKKSGIDIPKEQFYDICLGIDVAVENGCQYANRAMVDWLKKHKNNGKKIILVSDFYLPQEAYQDFFVNCGLTSLFDDVFISESCQASKHKGDLYDLVLKQLSVDAKDCVMIGDQKVDDVVNAEKHGIKGVHYFPFFHKVKTNISRIFHRDYSLTIAKNMGSRLRKHSLFGEYALSLYLFEERLASVVKKERITKLAFFSRGGYLLKELFDIYAEFSHQNVQSLYCYISRKVVYAARDDKDNSKAMLEEYLQPFIENGRLAFVDEGWYCHSQQLLSEIYHIPTLGLYLGVRGRDQIYENAICDRRGVLFDFDKNGKGPSKDYGVFCTNCSLYEQMLTSPEGSVAEFRRTSDGISPVLKDNSIESQTYELYTKEWQDRMRLSFTSLCVWLCGSPINMKQVANVFLKTDLVNNNKRCAFLNMMDASMVDNFQGAKQIAKSFKDAHIDVLNIMKNPTLYLNQICKIQRKIYKSFWLNTLYKMLAGAYYFYVKVISKIQL